MKNRLYLCLIAVLCTAAMAVTLSGCSSDGSPAAVMAAGIQERTQEDGTGAARDRVTAKEGDNLQEIIDEAGDDSEIVISPGTYTIDKPLVIKEKKDISVKGDGDVRIFGENIDMQIIMIRDCEKVELKGIRACHKSSGASDEVKVFDKRNGSVVDVENCGTANFDNCEFEGCGVYGIYTVNTAEVGIQGCYIHHNSWRALAFYGYTGVTNVLIKDCTITNNTDFIEQDGNVNVKYEGENVIKFNNQEGYNTR